MSLFALPIPAVLFECEPEESLRVYRGIKAANPEAKIISCWGGRVVLSATCLYQLPTLPEGYGFKGGAARAALEAELGSFPGPVRDLDLVRIGPGEQGEEARLAEMYMPDDAAHGWGVEEIRSLADYLNTRDFSINEVILVGDLLIASFDAIDDMLDRVIRPSAFEQNADGGVPTKLTVKALRFQAERALVGEFWEVLECDAF